MTQFVHAVPKATEPPLEVLRWLIQDGVPTRLLLVDPLQQIVDENLDSGPRWGVR